MKKYGLKLGKTNILGDENGKNLIAFFNNSFHLPTEKYQQHQQINDKFTST